MSDPLVLAYGPDPLQAFTLYDHPPGAPSLLFIHGGGWQRGDKDRLNIALEHHRARLASRYAVFSMNYRVAPATIFPGPVDDTHAMLDWLAAHAAEHDADPAVVLFTESAGSALGALAAVSGRHPHVRGFIGFAGVYDLTIENDTTALGQLAAAYLGCEPQDCLSTAQAASPRFNVAVPQPSLLVHGTADPVVGTYQSVLFASALGRRSVARVLFLPGGGHTGFAFTTPEVETAIDTFLRKRLPA